MITTGTGRKFPNAKISPKDAAGNDAPVQNPIWASSDETLLRVTPSADGLSAVVETVAPSSRPDHVARISVTADADLGDGVVPLIATSDDVFVQNDNQATTMTLDLGDQAQK